jgi:hypothetical protein
MLAYCQNCGSITERILIKGSDGIQVVLGNNFTNCPKCGALAKFLDGTFEFDKYGNATLLSGPPFTHAVIEAVRNLTEKAKAEKFTKEKFVEEANKISPGIGTSLAKFAPKNFNDLMLFFTFVLALLTYFECNHPNKTENNITNITIQNTTPKEKKVDSVKKYKPKKHSISKRKRR